jgi:hypothetical protein
MEKYIKDNLKMDIEMGWEVTIVPQGLFYIKAIGRMITLYNNDFKKFLLKTN